MATEAWYALRVRSNFEKKVSQYLETVRYRTFLPSYRDRRQWSDRVKDVEVPLFSGYVFCRMDIDDRLPVLKAPGVVEVVGFGGTFQPVDEEELDAVRTMVGSGLAVRPWPFVRVGDRVRLEKGPLAGLEGILTEVRNQFRVVLSVSLLQRSIAAEVDREWVARIPPPRQT